MQNVYCEPFCIERGYTFDIHQVSYGASDPYSCFMHFHEVHEFILFDDIEGKYFYNQGETTLRDNDIVFTPALEAHDFEVSEKPKSWHVIQVLPEFLQSQGLEDCESMFNQGLHLRLSSEQLNNVRQQVKWLKESYQQDPISAKSQTLLKLLILWIAEHATPVKAPTLNSLRRASGYEKLMPIINEFKKESAIELTMVEAASRCHMSPSHFSRQFKKVFRYSFSEYSLRHKLYISARLLSMRSASITDISYNLNFSSPSHFIAQFKRQFGSTPLQYQKELLERH